MTKTIFLPAFLFPLLVTCACNDGSKERAEAERLMKQTQEQTSKVLEQTNQIIDSNIKLANEQLNQAQKSLENHGVPPADAAAAQQQIDAARAKMAQGLAEAQKQAAIAQQEASNALAEAQKNIQPTK